MFSVVVVTFDTDLAAFLLENLTAAKTIARANTLTVLADFDDELTDGYLKEIVNETTTVFANLQVWIFLLILMNLPGKTAFFCVETNPFHASAHHKPITTH